MPDAERSAGPRLSCLCDSLQVLLSDVAATIALSDVAATTEFSNGGVQSFCEWWRSNVAKMHATTQELQYLCTILQ